MSQDRPKIMQAAKAPPGQITMRMRKFSALVAGGKAPMAAAAEAGYNKPKESAKELMKCDAVRREIDVQMGEMGLDERFFCEMLKEQIEAKTLDKEGREIIDFNARGKGLVIFKDIKGLDAPKRVETKHTSFEERLLTITNTTDLSDAEIEAIEAEFRVEDVRGE